MADTSIEMNDTVSVVVNEIPLTDDAELMAAVASSSTMPVPTQLAEQFDEPVPTVVSANQCRVVVESIERNDAPLIETGALLS
jgi:hypothetical protein